MWPPGVLGPMLQRFQERHDGFSASMPVFALNGTLANVELMVLMLVPGVVHDHDVAGGGIEQRRFG